MIVFLKYITAKYRESSENLDICCFTAPVFDSFFVHVFLISYTSFMALGVLIKAIEGKTENIYLKLCWYRGFDNID